MMPEEADDEEEADEPDLWDDYSDEPMGEEELDDPDAWIDYCDE